MMWFLVYVTVVETGVQELWENKEVCVCVCTLESPGIMGCCYGNSFGDLAST